MEFGEESGGVNVDDGFREDLSLVVDGLDFHTILEGFEVEFLEKGSFWGFYFFVLGADLEVLGDLDLTLDDLGGDVQSVEEVDLWGIKSSRSSGNWEINGGNGTDSCFSGDLVSLNFASELMDWGVSENKGDFVLEQVIKGLEFRDFSSELLFEVSELLFFDAADSHFKDFLDEGLSNGCFTFLEMTRTLLRGLSAFLICWIWLDPTLVKVVRMICL